MTALNRLLVAGLFLLTTAAWAATFGRVVPIGGQPSDLAMDPRRGLLYIANFTANRIDVLSLAEQKLQSPIHVPAQPASIALSPEGRFLVIGHFGSTVDPLARQNAVTVIDFDGGTRQTLTLANPPLAVAFGNSSQALIVTSKDFRLLEPLTGTIRLLAEGAGLRSETLPVAVPKYPPEILQASTGVSGDGALVYVLAQGESSAAVVQYRPSDASLRVVGLKTQPELGPRAVSVNRDGSLYVAGWALTNPALINIAQFQSATGKLNTGGHAFDWVRDRIYAQIPSSVAAGEGPVLHVVDTDNLAVRERLQLQENLAGRSLFSPDMEVLYAISDSGVTILPVGAISRTPRVAAVQEDLLFRAGPCDTRKIVRELDVVDPGGGRTEFSVSVTGSGVRVSPASGFTPARVQVEVDPVAFLNQQGTVAVPLRIRSAAAVNLPAPVRLLINTRVPEQRGTIVNVPGKLVDLLADPSRDRLYVLRQDRNLVLVFSAASLERIGAMRTGNTPTQMAMTRDNRYLIVGNDNSQYANVYDLDSMAPVAPIVFPPGHYPRSIAVSNRAMLASIRSAASPEHKIDRIDFEARTATELPALGIFRNSVSADTVLMASPSGESIVAAMPDGTVLLYDAASDTIVAGRKDLPAISGALAAFSDQLFVVDNHLLNSSLVPVGDLESETGGSSGFVAAGGMGLRTTTRSAATTGVIQRIHPVSLDVVRPTRTVESPVAPADLKTPVVGLTGQTILPFLRTLVPMEQRGILASLSVSGLSILPWDYDAAAPAPTLRSVINSADGSEAVAPGGLITVQGAGLSAVSVRNSELPAPTTLGDACLTVNGVLLPILAASPDRIEAQLPFGLSGRGRMVLRAAGGTSNTLEFDVPPAAPAVFRDSVAGQEGSYASVFRESNQGRVTLANPIHPEDVLVIFLTGMGATSPQVEAGHASPSDPAALAVTSPSVSLGGAALEVRFAGLEPGKVGVYRIEARVPYWAPEGMEVPLVIRQGAGATALSVRVVR